MPTTYEKFQSDDFELHTLKQHLMSNPKPTMDQIRHCSHDTRILYSKWNDLIVENNLLYKTKMVNDVLQKFIIIPEKERISLIHYYHEIKNSHLRVK